MNNRKSFIEFKKNGFEYITFQNNDVIYSQFISYQSIVSINRVYIATNNDIWLNNSFDWINTEKTPPFNYQYIKIPIFSITTNNNKTIKIYDESLAKFCSKYTGEVMTFADVKKNWTTILGYLFTDRHYINNKYSVWIKETNDMVVNVGKLDELRNKLIENFNNWSNCFMINKRNN